MKVNWNKFLFYSSRRGRKNKKIGHNIFTNCRLNGKFVILDGLCVSISGAKHGLLASSLSVKSIGGETVFFVNFPLYFSGSFNYKIIGLTYGFKINCSKLVEARIK